MADSTFPVTIYHNPQCGTSRKVLGFIRDKGIEPNIIDYRKTGWTRDTLETILKQIGDGPRAILRKKEPAAKSLGLTDANATDEQILAAMMADPILVERPIVVTPKGTRVCRPPESVAELL